ncbi:MAG: hypothetical protein HYW86_05475 [Candidatus Roizmanbacteria bacterium]|nr:MAG: hypothetical protein HYW86_05475 [Candidatus Roizmanbacteria bacterium]
MRNRYKLKCQMSNVKCQNFRFLLALGILLIFGIWILKLSKVHAANMESSRFRIQGGNINIGATSPSSASYNLSMTLGQTAAGQFSRDGYIVKAGFQYIYSIIPFRFSISDISIDLGTLVPNTPSTAATTLTVSFGSAGQYQVTAVELGTLKTLSDNSIDDTVCNGGGSACSESSSNLWTSSSAYGFGYNMSGNDVPSDFLSSDYYRPFPDSTVAESPAVVMSNADVGSNRQSTVTFKTNISTIQPAGSYQTIINFVATPSF